MNALLWRALAITWLLTLSAGSHAQDVADQWRSGLTGAKLTAYAGSAISSNSTLTVIDFCRNGRYRYYREGSWSVAGSAAGASNSAITGTWDVTQRGFLTLLTYKPDAGDKGAFSIYLQHDGRVNIGGQDYAAQPGGANC